MAHVNKNTNKTKLIKCFAIFEVKDWFFQVVSTAFFPFFLGGKRLPNVGWFPSMSRTPRTPTGVFYSRVEAQSTMEGR